MSLGTPRFVTECVEEEKGVTDLQDELGKLSSYFAHPTEIYIKLINIIARIQLSCRCYDLIKSINNTI